MLVKQFLDYMLFLTYSTSSPKNNACNKFESYPTLLTHGIIKSRHCFYDPFVLSNTGTMIETLGYKTENHTVITGDKYILNLIRVVPKTGVKKNSQPIFLQHGVLFDASCFLFTGNRSLVSVLVKNGYDLWLGNTRSTQNGRKHVNLTDSDKKFWNFNLDDMAANDIRYSLLKVAEITKQKGNIIYIGHSMGTTLCFMYSSRFASDNLLRGIVALSPVVFWDQKDGLTHRLKLVPYIGKLLNFFKINAILTDVKFVHNAIFHLCIFSPSFCRAFLINLPLGQSDLFIPSNLSPYFTYWPDSVSVGQLVQFAQMAPTYKFSMYDYGRRKNKKKYGKKRPPQYNLKKIKISVYLFYGRKDTVSKTSGVRKLFRLLGTDKNKKDIQIVPINNTNPSEQFGHIEFLSGDRIETLFYPDLFRYLRKLTPVT